MLVDLYAVIREKENGVQYRPMGCFSCAFAFGSYFRVWSSYQKNRKKIKNLKNVKTKNLKLFNNLGFSSPDLGGGQFCFQY